MLSLALLTIPGLVLYSRIKKTFTLPELAAASVVLSLILIPFAAFLAVPLGIHPAIPLAFLTLYLLYRRGGKIHSMKGQLKPLLSALFFAVLVFIILSQYFAGAVVHPTHASDTVWHLSNAQWFAQSPQFPPEDSYSPGYFLNANWLMTVLLSFVDVRIAFALCAFALFLSVYLIAEKLFKSGLAAAWLYMLLAGLSWLVQSESVFQPLIFSPLNFKFDPTLLFFFLPQPQAIGLLLFAFTLFLFFEKRHALLGITLAVLAGYHLQTAATLLIALLVYNISRKQFPRFFPWFAVAVIPFILPLLSITGTHFFIEFQPDSLKTIALTIFPLALLAWPQRKSDFLPFLATLSVLFAIFISIPLTWNGYRFLAYAAIPLAILASPSLRKKLPVIIAILLCVSSLVLTGLYIGHQYNQASPADLSALEWAKENTPQDAIFLEAYSLFPRVPLLAHRRILYGGYYGSQYHGYDGRQLVESITGETNATRLRQKLKGIDYVFFGEREKELPFAQALSQFEEVYPGIHTIG